MKKSTVFGNRTHQRRNRAVLTATLALLAATSATGQTTTVEELIMYGIDADTNNLLRYSFETDTFTVIGTATNESGQTLTDTEALGYIPSGPAKGMYCIPRKGAASGKLIKINPLDAGGTTVADLGWNTAQGMCAFQDVSGNWGLLVGIEPNGGSDPPRELHAVNPMNGASVFVCELGDADPEGLALAPDGTLYMIQSDALKTVQWMDGSGDVTEIGDLGYSKPEALEFGFGFGEDGVDLSSVGVPAAWTANGVIWGFDDDDNELFVVDPATGNTRAIACSFATVDCEGLVFTTKYGDGYGQVSVMPHD